MVYKAVDRQTKQKVALKKIRFDTDDEGIPVTAIREVAVLKSMEHPNIVKLLDLVGEVNFDLGMILTFWA